MKRLRFDLILLGDPTSGKDTQAKLLKQKFTLQSVESGKHWRKMLYAKTKEGALLRKTREKGLPAPVKLIKKFLTNSVRNTPKNKDIIFVGTPRLKPEAQFLKKILEQRKRDFFVLYLRIPDDEIIRRTDNRQRLKIEALAVKTRIKWHKDQVSKTVKYFKNMKKLKFINGKQSIKKVNQDVMKAINDYTKSKRD